MLMPVAYALESDISITIENTHRGLSDIWAIRRDRQCLSKDGVWVDEPSPSERDDAFKTSNRFTLEEAKTLLLKPMETPNA